MGNYRFRLSDMMPNAWFYKLKDMGKPKTQNTKKRLPTSISSTTIQRQQPIQYSHSRNSHYYTPRGGDMIFQRSPTNRKSSHTHFPIDPPRKSSKRSRTKRKTIYKPSPKHSTATTHHHHTHDQSKSTDHSFLSPDSSTSPDQPDHHEYSPSTLSNQSLNGLTSSWSSSCSCRVSSSATDIIIDMNDKEKPSTYKKINPNFDGFHLIPEALDLPRILTKISPKPINQEEAPPTVVRKSSPKLEEERESCASQSQLSSIKKIVKENNNKPRKSVSYSTGMKLRSNSPRIELSSKKANYDQQGHGRSKSVKKSSQSQRKSFSQSLAIVKSSFDPQKDFRESMVEMIVENNIRASQDLEELLACYLTLNSDEYHHLIVKAFEQIWFTLPSF